MSLPAAFLRDAQKLIPEDRRFDDPLSTLAFGSTCSVMPVDHGLTITGFFGLTAS